MLKWSETALADVVKLRRFIEAHNLKVARRAAEALKKGAALLLDHPGLGRRLEGRQDRSSEDDNRRIISCTRNIYAGILLLFKHKLSSINNDLIWISGRNQTKKPLTTKELRKDLSRLMLPLIGIELIKLEIIEMMPNTISARYNTKLFKV